MLSANEHVQSALEQELDSSTLGSAAPGSVAARVQAKLLSSKLIALSISAVVDDLRAILHPLTGTDEPEEDKGSHKKAKNVVSDADGDVEMDVDEEEPGQEQEEEEGSESGTIGDDEREQDDGWESGSLSGSPEVGPMLQDDEDEAMAPAYEKASGTSTFLPSLSVGFVRRGPADSDWSDGDEKAGDIPRRKNRRGQRARQA